VFAFMGAPAGRWYLYAGLQKLELYRTGIGAGLNILLNMLLIPKYSALGAAYATLIALAISNVLFNALDFRTRSLFAAQVRALTLYSLRK
jgi:PST family polysaccharide transporter